MSHKQAIKDIKNWDVSRSVMQFLLDDLEMIDWLKSERSKKPFPLHYRPAIIEVFYNGICQIISIHGQLTYFQPFPDKAICGSIEIKFDREVAMFIIQGEMVIDRTPSNIQLDRLLGTNLPVA
jgi:hypothetical protein